MSSPVAAVPRVIRISEVNKTMVNWKTLVHVLESHRVRVIQMDGVSKAFRRFEFGDSQGITVSAVAYNDDISHVNGLLLPFKKYYTSAVDLCEIPESTPPRLYRFYWVITSKTVVEEVIDEGGPVLPFYFHLRSFKSLHFVADTAEFINVMGIVAHAFPARYVYMEGTMCHGRDYVIVDHSKRPVLLTLWEDFEAIEGRVIDETMPAMPIIIAMRVRVLTENYLSLSTQPSSVILVAPDVLEARQLDSWCERNVSELVHMIFDTKSYADLVILLPPVRDPTLTAISSVASFTPFDRATVWIKGRVEIACPVTRFWHLTCPHCFHPYDFPTTLGIWCLSCGLGMYIFPRAWIRLTIHDATGYVNVVALGAEAEKLIGLNALQLYRTVDDEFFGLYKQVRGRLERKTLLCYIKHSSDVIRSTAIAKFTVVTCYLC